MTPVSSFSLFQPVLGCRGHKGEGRRFIALEGVQHCPRPVQHCVQNVHLELSNTVDHCSGLSTGCWTVAMSTVACLAECKQGLRGMLVCSDIWKWWNWSEKLHQIAILSLIVTCAFFYFALIEPFVLIEIACIFVLCCVGLHEFCALYCSNCIGLSEKA